MLIKRFGLLAVVLCVSPFALAAGDVAADKQQVRIDVQQICPVSGNKLGEHGAPIKVSIGKQKEQVYLCCRACLKQAISKEHWATIHDNFRQAQGICPVMKKKLPKDAKWTIVDGRIVYVCCPPCIEKVTADPETYLRNVDASYEVALKERDASK